MEFERIVEMSPAFDRRDPDPKKNYGIHGMELRFVLKGELGAVQFVIYTNWQLPHVRDANRAKMSPDLACLFEPMAADVGIHSKVPHYEDHRVMRSDCPYTGGPCYYGGSSLQAVEWMDEFLALGTDWLWGRLEKQYRDCLVAETKESHP